MIKLNQTAINDVHMNYLNVLNERLYLLCNQNSIENEHHFWLSCPVFNADRDNLVN